ncbi:hypothetical protein VitviT2T_013298 [Vitis vinifera]|uniref:Uncharacterized protein n=1 Tax=Vitis vinifera TaxID=29760 RepID=A0ABY9CGA1_VITVI|nr:hypothetical protein VitviT2T_013298 [Vitis vinifera]
MPTTLTILLIFAPLVKGFFNLPEGNRTTFRVGLRHFLQTLPSFFRAAVNKQNKKEKGSSQRKKKDLQRQRLLTLFLFLAVCYESGKPGILNMRDPSK